MGLKEKEAQQVAAAILDWRDPDDLALPPGVGKEDEYYSALAAKRSRQRWDKGDPPIYRCKNDRFSSVDELLSVAQLVPATGAIIVTTPQEVSLLDSRKAVNFARKLNLNIYGIIENMSGMVCPHCGKRINLFKEGGGEKAAKELGIPFLGKIPIDPMIVESGDDGKPFVIHYPESKASKAFNEIVEKILHNGKKEENIAKG